MPISIWLDFSFWIFAKVSICQIFYQSKKWWFVKNPPVRKRIGAGRQEEVENRSGTPRSGHAK
jgi:hypothetical protein